MDGYNHISFRREWEITVDSAYMLGECHALVHALTDIPLKPEYRQGLLSVSLRKGAQATTAIEGNTLSEDEIAKIQEGWSLPPSKEYLQIEVNNILEAFNTLLHEIVTEDKVEIVTPELIKKFHFMIGKDLGEHFDAIPGRFRDDRRHVGPYLAPEHKYVPELIENLCVWLGKEFHYNNGQNFTTAVIQAIVTHVYIEWIHPFGDGNGRTGRLMEFYILLRAGLPSIVSHILSNFYNLTRPEYYRQLDRAKKEGDLTGFIQYALQGFRDGLKENLNIIQESQFSIFWQHYIYEIFADLKYTKSGVFKRKRALMLQMPINKPLTVDELLEATPDVAKRYATVGRPTVARDLKELQELNLIRKEGRSYIANTRVLKAMMPGKKS
jgi:Fic family protein